MYTVSMFMYQGGHASVIHHLMISVASNSGESDMMGGSPMLFLLKDETDATCILWTSRGFLPASDAGYYHPHFLEQSTQPLCF